MVRAMSSVVPIWRLEKSVVKWALKAGQPVAYTSKACPRKLGAICPFPTKAVLIQVARDKIPHPGYKHGQLSNVIWERAGRVAGGWLGSFIQV